MATLLALFCFILVSSIGCEETINENRDSRFSIFQIIKFKNEPCIGGSNRNGTCFTAAECDNAGGTESGSCADGFGVCCIVILTAGSSTSLNQSYIVQTASTALTSGSMRYTICPCSSDVCRIRFDFTGFTIEGPATAPGTAGGATTTNMEGTAIGDCLTDTFTISSPGGTSPPLICGENTGQHMIVDTDGKACSDVNFGLGTGTNSRNWDIMVTQFRCGEEAGGPPGCLQWHMEPTGKIRSFNFPNQAVNTPVADSVVHISSQNYYACVRKPATSNHICYSPCTLTADATIANMGSSFGVSVSPDDTAAKSGVGGSFCLTDWVEIMGGVSAINAAIATVNVNAGVNDRFCGRSLQVANNMDLLNGIAAPVCTASTPFRLGVRFDANEADGADTADVSEASTRPGGITGFSLCYSFPAATTG